jgi:large subunit ribosomal protein L6
MSRIGKQPVIIGAGVTVNINGQDISVKGPKGELKFSAHPNIKLIQEDGKILVSRINDLKLSKSLHGLTRSIVNNMVEGVSKGFEKKLEILGVGYRASVAGNKLTLSLGFSHPIEYTMPQGVSVEIDKEKKNILIVQGIDKEQVGQAAAEIRSFKKPEPYKGKGIRYQGEYVAQKAGKAAGKDK